MNTKFNHDADLSLHALERIDVVCTAFEKSWAIGNPQQIEELLNGFQGEERKQLLLELLLLEFLYHVRTGEMVSCNEYRQRFSADVAIVDAAIQGATRDEANRVTDAGQILDTLEIPLPSEVGNYQILEEIAQGGMGIVYKAKQKGLGRIVALKMMLNGQFSKDEQVDRFEREARLASRLRHPNIVAVYEIGRHERTPYYSMDYVDGQDLGQIINGEPLPLPKAAKYVMVAAKTVHKAHQEGILHRDLKPSNILIDQEDRVRITDFGLAKVICQTENQTATKGILGSPSYMSPEQASGNSKEIGPASDIYSLGAVLYELLTGRPPFAARSVLDTLDQVKNQPPVPPKNLNPEITRDLERVCLKCLQKKPQDRYNTALELADDLILYGKNLPVKARPIHPVHRLFRWGMRNQAIIGMWGLIALLAVYILIPKQDDSVAGRDSATSNQESDLPGERPPEAGSQNSGSDGNIEGVPAPPKPPAPSFDAEITTKFYLDEASPFDFGEIELSFGPEKLPVISRKKDVWIIEESGRILYPAVKLETNDQGQTSKASIHFLFQGDAKLDLTVYAAGKHEIPFSPTRNENLDEERLKAKWWESYTANDAARQKMDEITGHDMLKRYLQHMLARRLKLKLPPNLAAPQSNKLTDAVSHFFHSMLGTSAMRVALQKTTLLDVSAEPETADQPLPEPVIPPVVEVPDFTPQRVEELAGFVPEECFYVRFETFENWKWFFDSLGEWGGNLDQLIAQRGIDFGYRNKLEKQLALDQDTGRRLFTEGDVQEAALIGEDTFYAEGAAFGVIFRAGKTNKVEEILNANTQKFLRNFEDEQVKNEPYKTRGRTVSKLFTPNNSIRSFHAVHKNTHLLTTSRHIVDRFYEVIDTKQQSLAALQEFQYMRSQFPLARQDDGLIYLSAPFFMRMISPHYRIEMTRRARALADLELVQMARWAAIAENKLNINDVPMLVENQFLTESILERPDGSFPTLDFGKPHDTLRGAAGTFKPIPDLNIDEITQNEFVAYNRFTKMYRSHWNQVTPITVALNRHDGYRPDTEVIAGEVRVLSVQNDPFAELVSRRFSSTHIGPQITTDCAMQFSAAIVDHVDSQIVLEFGFPPEEQDLSLPLRNGVPEFSDDFVNPLLQQGFLAHVNSTWGRLPFSFILARAKSFLNQKTLNSHRLDDTYIHSLSPSVKQSQIDSTQLVYRDRPASIRASVQDLSNSGYHDLAKTFFYWQTRQLSESNIEFLHGLMQQFHLEPEKAEAHATDLLRGELTFPLQREFDHHGVDFSPHLWKHSHLPSLIDKNEILQAPEEFHSPFLDWFRGINIDTAVSENNLIVHFELITMSGDENVNQRIEKREEQAKSKLKVLRNATVKLHYLDRLKMLQQWMDEYSATQTFEDFQNSDDELWSEYETDAQLLFHFLKQDRKIEELKAAQNYLKYSSVALESEVLHQDFLHEQKLAETRNRREQNPGESTSNFGTFVVEIFKAFLSP